ncbi:MAG TPA: hypothetical protein VFZ31_02945 [Vicinamibacterales bacterium]
MTSLARSDHRRDDVESLRARVAELETELAARDDENARVRAALDAFRIRYRQQVGRLHEQLDALELALAEAELGILSERVANAATTNEPPIGVPPESAARSLTTDAVRKLFRDVAKAIHPDLAEDDEARRRRHSLMIEANRAYASGDEEQLRAILEAWERSPDAVQGTDHDALRARLSRRIEQIEDQLVALSGDLAALKDTSLWKLKAMVDDEAAKGNDLIQDMVRRLNRDILVATNRLDALRPPPR